MGIGQSYIRAIDAFIKAMKYSDKEFLKNMIAHHNMALDMAKEALNSSENDEVKSLAKSIIKAQTTEIALMEAIIKKL